MSLTSDQYNLFMEKSRTVLNNFIYHIQFAYRVNFYKIDTAINNQNEQKGTLILI